MPPSSHPSKCYTTDNPIIVSLPVKSAVRGGLSFQCALYAMRAVQQYTAVILGSMRYIWDRNCFISHQAFQKYKEALFLGRPGTFWRLLLGAVFLRDRTRLQNALCRRAQLNLWGFPLTSWFDVNLGTCGFDGYHTARGMY